MLLSGSGQPHIRCRRAAGAQAADSLRRRGCLDLRRPARCTAGGSLKCRQTSEALTALESEVPAGLGFNGGPSPSAVFQTARMQVPLFQALAEKEDQQQDHISVEHIPGFAAVGSNVYEVLKIDHKGHKRRASMKRRDLLRAHRLQPRDLRRFDSSLGLNKSSDITIKENVLLVSLGGVRAIISANTITVFDPDTPSASKFEEIVLARQQQEGEALDPRTSPRSLEGNYVDDNEAPAAFELDMLESALILCTGRLESELLAVTKRATAVASMLPRDVTPVNLEVLRRLKLALVELESKAASLRGLLEEILDDDEELAQLNLSSRPAREAQQRERERDRLKRSSEWEREREREDGDVDKKEALRRKRAAAALASASLDAPPEIVRKSMDAVPDGVRSQDHWHTVSDRFTERISSHEALEEMEEAEAAERELEEVEDLLDYYLQRAASTQTEAERLLAGARDLEESIGVSLSARRFEVNRLELALSIGSFAAALGAVVAGIFGMNLQSTFEQSVIGFWGTTVGIILGCCAVFLALFNYTRRRRIL